MKRIMRLTHRRGHRLTLGILALALAASGCISTDPETVDASTSADGSPRSLLPDETKKAGEIKIAGDASYPPIGFMAKDGTTIKGLDSDMADALGDVLDIKFNHVNATFDSIIPGLQGNKYQLGMSWINDTEERRRVVDFIDYARDGSSILVRADGPTPKSLTDMCGMKVAVQKGTAQQTDAAAQDEECTSNGEEGIEVLTYPDQNAANLALSSGRADVTIADTPVAVWQQQQTDGELLISGDPYGPVYHGIAAPKGSELVPAVAAAMQELMDNGTYQKILDKWGMGDAAIDEVLINGEPVS